MNNVKHALFTFEKPNTSLMLALPQGTSSMATKTVIVTTAT